MTPSTIQLWGRYINLDKAQDRREAMERRIEAAGLSRALLRFPALAGDGRECRITQGELGCFRSHEAVLESAPAGSFILVLEDDAIVPPDFPARIARCIRAAEPTWDMLFLNQTGDFRVVEQLKAMLRMKREMGDVHRPDFMRVALLDAAKWYSWGCAAYIVHPRSLDKLRGLLSDSGHGYQVPIDNLFRRWVRTGELKACVTFPYVAGIDAGAKTQMPDRAASRNTELYLALMELFTAARSAEPVRERVAGYTDQPELDEDALAVSRIIYRYLAN